MIRDGVVLGQRIKERRKQKELGLRGTARALGVSASYLTDIEKDNRVPTDEKLQALAKWLELDIAELRVLANRADKIVHEVATQDKVTAEKVPSFLRLARGLKREEWDELIRRAKQMGGDRSKKR